MFYPVLRIYWNLLDKKVIVALPGKSFILSLKPSYIQMSKELAVVMDVAGTILRMYRVAKDIEKGTILAKVVTWELIMERKGRVLVVPQIDPSIMLSYHPDDRLGKLIDGREQLLEISCSSSPVSKSRVMAILAGSQAKIGDLMEVYQEVEARCPGNYITAGMIVDAQLQEVAYALSTGGTPFPGLKDVLASLQELGADIFVASGDSMRSLAYLRELGIDLSRVYPVSGPMRKKEIVVNLKSQYGRVVMIGDGLNDLYALRAADLGILTVQQDTRPTQKLRDAADRIITNIQELPKILGGDS